MNHPVTDVSVSVVDSILGRVSCDRFVLRVKFSHVKFGLRHCCRIQFRQSDFTREVECHAMLPEDIQRSRDCSFEPAMGGVIYSPFG